MTLLISKRRPIDENIGGEEASASIDLAKEILKARYQLQSLVDRLQALKKDPSASAS